MVYVFEYGASLQPAQNEVGAPGSRRGLLLVPDHVSVCCAGGVPAGSCQLLFCIVFAVLCMCAATYNVHALYFLLVLRLLLRNS